MDHGNKWFSHKSKIKSASWKNQGQKFEICTREACSAQVFAVPPGKNWIRDVITCNEVSGTVNNKHNHSWHQIMTRINYVYIINIWVKKTSNFRLKPRTNPLLSTFPGAFEARYASFTTRGASQGKHCPRRRRKEGELVRRVWTHVWCLDFCVN